MLSLNSALQLYVFPIAIILYLSSYLYFLLSLLYAPCCTDHVFYDLCTVFYGDVE